MRICCFVQSGALAVAGGRDIVEPINKLLNLPFCVKIATQDWHPLDHVSFASNHAPPGNKPGTVITIHNPENPSETEQITLWPDHCVQHSEGAQLVQELDASKLNHFVRKGTDKNVEMYSAFRANYRSPCISESDLLELLRRSAIDKVLVVGLAADYCVKYTAMHSAEESFQTVVLADATRAIGQSEQSERALRHDLARHGVAYMSIAEAGLAYEGARSARTNKDSQQPGKGREVS